MASDLSKPILSLMLAVPDAPAASEWYQRALGARELWNLGSVIGLEIEGAPFFLGQPEKNGWESPTVVGTTTLRVEVFCDDQIDRPVISLMLAVPDAPAASEWY